MSQSALKHPKCVSENDSHVEYTLLSDSDAPNRMEIALETVSPWTLRAMLSLWYGVLLFGLVMIRLDLHMQWECANFCGGKCHEATTCPASFHCVSEAAEDTITWTSGARQLTRSRLNRFPHLLIDVHKRSEIAGEKNAIEQSHAPWNETNPIHQRRRGGMPRFHPVTNVLDDVLLEKREAPGALRRYPLNFEIRLRGQHLHNRAKTKKRFEYTKNSTRAVRCADDLSSCDAVLIPLDVPNFIEVESFTVNIGTKALGVSSEALDSSVSIISQKSSYTLFGIVLRYVLFVVSLVNFVLFFSKLGVQCLVPGRSKEILIEQVWVIILQAFFILYANPFHISCVFLTSEDSFRNKLLQFIEFHIADYFTYVVLTWNLVLVNCARFIPRRLPLRTHLLCVSGLFVMIGLDCLLVVLSKASWTETAQDFELTLVESPRRIRYVLFLLLAVQYSYFIIGFLLAVKLYFKLYKAPYFETRTQQLSFRLFVFVMWLYYVYRIIQSIALHHGTQLSSLLSYHRSHQMSELLIAFVYTQIVTFSYSPARHNENAPPPPTSSLWKRVVWSDAWYQWLRHHGGSLYFFNTRDEEEKFLRIQAIANANRPQEKSDVRPVLFLERLVRKIARRFTNILTLTRLGNVPNRGFFCLEKAIDCFNLSWEVYFRVPSASPEVVLKADESPSNELEKTLEKPMLPPIVLPEALRETPRGRERSPANPLLGAPFLPRDVNTSIEIRPMDIERFGFCLVKTFLIEDVQAVISENDKTILIAFRGTSTRKNVKYDIKFSRSNIEVGTKNFLLDLLFVPCVHSGFNLLWKKIEEEMLQELCQIIARSAEKERENEAYAKKSPGEPSLTPQDDHFKPFRAHFRKRSPSKSSKPHGKELIVTGHSLGGAIANLCAYSIATRFNVSPTVYTFGSPRIGNTRFRHMYDERVPNTFRIVNQSDIVSRFNMMMDNPHVGCEIAIDRHGNIICHPTFIERILRPWTRGLGLHHHLLASYGLSLDAVSKRQGAEMRVFGGEPMG